MRMTSTRARGGSDREGLERRNQEALGHSGPSTRGILTMLVSRAVIGAVRVAATLWITVVRVSRALSTCS